ncbi:MAG: glycosyltransferase family 39 protein [Bacteroidia bacterium]|nr:glycosyltransferase family 39 protein [Bacteroidia bacterium]
MIVRRDIEYFVLCISLLLCWFTLYYRLDNGVIELWDEGRNVTNALEMVSNGNLITRHYEGKPDMYELKPPFLTWLQSASILTFGFNEFAVRFPVALFSFLTICLLFYISKKITNSLIPGAISALVLATTMGYIGKHAARNGEHDAVLAFFSIATCFFWYQFLQLERLKYLTLASIALFFAWFTKSVSGIVVVPSLLIYAICFRPKVLLKFNKQIILFAIGFFILIGMYYFIRNSQSPGYLNAVWDGELFGRYFKGMSTNSNKEPGFCYYIVGFDRRFYPYNYAIILAIVYAFFIPKKELRTGIKYFIFQALWFLIVISIGAKNYWYDVPLFPIFALIIGFSLWHFISSLKIGYSRIVTPIICILFLIHPYKRAVNMVFADVGPQTDVANLCRYLKHAGKESTAPISVVTNAYECPLYLYQTQLLTHGMHIQICKPNQIQSGQYVLFSDPEIHSLLEHDWNMQLVEHTHRCYLMHIGLPK